MDFTAAERDALQALIAAWNAFLALPIEHPDDVQEFRHGLHALQDKVLSRPMRRVINGDGAPSISERSEADRVSDMLDNFVSV